MQKRDAKAASNEQTGLLQEFRGDCLQLIRRPILSDDVISFTECRGKLGEYFEKTRRTHRPIVVTQNGKPTSVIVSIADWEPLSNSWENEQRIAGQVLADLRTSEEQFARGEFHSNEEVFGMMRKKYEALLSAKVTSA